MTINDLSHCLILLVVGVVGLLKLGKMSKYLIFVLALAMASAAYVPPEGGPSNIKNTQRGQYQIHNPKNGTTTTRAAQIVSIVWNFFVLYFSS